MREIHERARRAAQVQEFVVGFAMALLLVIVYGWVALHGDDIRAHRLGITTEQLQSLEESEARLERIKLERENRCGNACIGRIDSAGEVWE